MSPKKERVPWQRLVLSLIGIGLIVGKWQWGVWHLYSLPEHSITSFTSISTNSDYVIGAIVIFMITGKLIYDWKNLSVTNVLQQAQNIKQSIEEKKEETITQIIKHYEMPAEQELTERYGDR